MVMPRARGFTLLELIRVMVLIGILGAVGASRFFDRQTFDGRAFADQTRAMLRHAQKLAVAQHRDVLVRFDGNSVALCYVANDSSVASCDATQIANQVRAPAGRNSASSATLAACSNSNSWFCEALPRGITTSYLPAIASTTPFSFDAGGKPYNYNDDRTKATSTFVTHIVRITGADGKIYDVTVEKETGYVH